MATDINNIVFLGLNSSVAALDRNTGENIWTWRAPKPFHRGYVSLLLLNDSQLIVSVNGYTYCLDPLKAELLWFNDLPGFGTGVTSIAAAGKNTTQTPLLAAAAKKAADRRANAR
jgi:outer membrane protein assembly factor BamB